MRTDARSNARSNATGICGVHMLGAMHVRTDGRTNEEGFSPTSQSFSFVTRTRTYGELIKVGEG